MKRISQTRLQGYVTDGFGRALHWQCRGQRFDPAMLHQNITCKVSNLAGFLLSNRYSWKQIEKSSLVAIKIKQIGKALEHGCYHCALALTFTLPDICGQVAYPDLHKPEQRGERYKKWFDEYVSKYYQCPEDVTLMILLKN